MRRAIRNLAHRRTLPNHLHYPLVGLSRVYHAGLVVRDLPYRLGLRRPRDLGLPTISVGNITWGGTGKTPMVERLCKMMLGRKLRPLVLVHKYGNDEEHQLALRVPACVVSASKDRERAAVAALEVSKDLGVVILDDGLQQKRIQCHLNITMVNVLNPFGNMYLIPRGILREPPLEAVTRSHVVVLHNWDIATETQRSRAMQDLDYFMKTSHNRPRVVKTGFRPTRLIRHTHGQSAADVSMDILKARNTSMFAGIGNATGFRTHLSQLGGGKVMAATFFEDHHCYTLEDMKKLKTSMKQGKDSIVVTTQKDLLRRGGVDLVKELGTLHVLEGEINMLHGASFLYKEIDRLLTKKFVATK